MRGSVAAQPSSREGKAVGLCPQGTREAAIACHSSRNNWVCRGQAQLILLFTFSLLSKLHYQHREVEQLHDLWRQHVAALSALREEVPADQEGAVEDVRSQQSVPEALPAQKSTAEGSGWKSTLDVTPSQVANVGEEEPGPSSWNFSFEDLQQVVAPVPSSAGTAWCWFHFPYSLGAPV